MELMSFGEKNVVCLTGGENHTYNVGIISHSSSSSIELTHELEKAHLEIAYLKEIIELMKTTQRTENVI